MSISDQQVVLRQKLVDCLRADSDAIRDHLKLVEYMVTDPELGVLWSDTYDFSIKDIEVKFDWGYTDNKEAHRHLTKALELKIAGLLRALCREVLDDAGKRADTALARAAQSTVIEPVSESPRQDG